MLYQYSTVLPDCSSYCTAVLKYCIVRSYSKAIMLQNHSTCYYIVQWYVLVESAKEVSGVGTGTESLPTIMVLIEDYY